MKKVKKLFTAVSLVLSLTATVNFAACDALFNDGQSQEEHVHSFSEWTLSSPAANCNGATFTRNCQACDYVEERKGTDDDHVWEYGYDNTHHWEFCRFCEETKEKDWHHDDGAGTCSICGALIPTASVEYEVSSDGSYAIVTGYDAAETNAIVVASEQNGVPVKEIKASAFEGCSHLESIILPDSITTIGSDAFNGCESLLAVYLSNNVVSLGENAFAGCESLTIFTARDKENIPQGWEEGWNASRAHVIWEHSGKRATPVSVRASIVSDSMVREDDSSRKQIITNPDSGSVNPPEIFSKITRYDRKATTPGTPWESGNLWHYNWNQTNLTDYQDVWFAAKLVNLNWVFVHDKDKEYTPPSWMHVHIEQTGETKDGYTLWSIELSIGGYVCTTIENQIGRTIDDDRPKNSIARLFWDEGFGSPDGNAILIYNFIPEEERDTTPASIYSTEILGIRVGA